MGERLESKENVSIQKERDLFTSDYRLRLQDLREKDRGQLRVLVTL